MADISWGEQYDKAEELASRREELAGRVVEFYNTCHEPDTGKFCEGPDGPGRVKDNMEKVGKTIPKNAPQWMKNMLSRKLGAARKEGAALLPKNAPQYMKGLITRRKEQAVLKGEK